MFYLDVESNGKTGFSSKGNTGSIRYFGVYHSQNSLNHSISDMTPEYVLSIAPP